MDVHSEPFIPCLNFCRADPDTGYCLTCGRPPAPVNTGDLARPLFDGSALAALRAMGDGKRET